MQRFSTYTVSKAFRGSKNALDGSESENGEDVEELEENDNVRDAEAQTEEMKKPDMKEMEVQTAIDFSRLLDI